MTIPANIDRFNRFTLILFKQLYLSFPLPTNVDVSSLMMYVVPTGETFEATFHAIAPAGEAIQFLAAEGFLTYKGNLLDGTEYHQVRLTMKGLAILGSVPNSLEKKETLVSKILAVAGKGLKDAGSEQVSDLANQAFTLALASAPALAAMWRP